MPGGATNTVLSVDVDARLTLPSASLAAPAATDTVIGPSNRTSGNVTVYVAPAPGTSLGRRRRAEQLGT